MPVMAVDPNGEELVTILVAVGIGLAIGAAVGGGTAITVQAVHGRELNDMDWGIKGVGGAILVGAVSGAVSGGFGALGSGLLNATVSGALASMSGQGVGYLSGQNKGEHFWENVAGGAVAGAVGGGFAGLADGACTECVVTGLVTGPAAGYGSSAFLSGDEVTGEGLALALGGSLAGAAANYGAAYAVQEISSNPLDNQRVRAALQDAYRDSGYDGTQIHTNDWGQGSRNRYTPGPGHEISGTIDPAPGGSFKVERSPMGDTLGRHRNRSPGHGQGHLLGFHTHPPDGDPAPSGIKKGKDGDVPLAIHTSTPEIVVSESEVWEATASGEKKYLGARESVLAVGRAIDVWVPAVVATQAARDADRWCVRGPGCR